MRVLNWSCSHRSYPCYCCSHAALLLSPLRLSAKPVWRRQTTLSAYSLSPLLYCLYHGQFVDWKIVSLLRNVRWFLSPCIICIYLPCSPFLYPQRCLENVPAMVYPEMSAKEEFLPGGWSPGPRKDLSLFSTPNYISCLCAAKLQL